MLFNNPNGPLDLTRTELPLPPLPLPLPTSSPPPAFFGDACSMEGENIKFLSGFHNGDPLIPLEAEEEGSFMGDTGLRGEKATFLLSLP